MRTKMTWGVVAVALAIATGCGGGTTEMPDGGGPTGDSGPVGTDSGLRPDSGTTGDGNDSFAEAVDLALGTAESAELDPEGDVDYYAFDGTEGQWIGIFTETTMGADPEAMGVIDTVITLFDSSMTQIAENDDALPRVNTDSALYTRLPSAGTYYVRVQDYNTWMPADPQGERTDLAYDLTVAELGGTAVAIDNAANDTAETAQPLMLVEPMGGTSHFGYVAGRSESTSDVDVYSFTVSLGPNTNFFLQPSGTTASGSTGLATRAWITSVASGETIARIATAQSTEMSPPLAPGDYLLWVDAPAATGANDFYYLRAFIDGEDNPAESMELTNGLPLTPEALTMTMDATGNHGFILATLGAGDVDYYSFPVAAGEAVSVTCGSRTNGSGLIDLRLQLQTSDGTAVGTPVTETATMDAVLNDVAVPAAGTYLLQIQAMGQAPDVTGNWVRCGVHAAAPTP